MSQVDLARLDSNQFKSSYVETRPSHFFVNPLSQAYQPLVEIPNPFAIFTQQKQNSIQPKDTYCGFKLGFMTVNPQKK